jgi:hypothetical protein
MVLMRCRRTRLESQEVQILSVDHSGFRALEAAGMPPTFQGRFIGLKRRNCWGKPSCFFLVVFELKARGGSF